MLSLNYLRGRRLWVVRNFQVWGTSGEAGFYYLGVENVYSIKRVMFGQSGVGGTAQDVLFSELTDFRGNWLPANIKSPKVIVRFRSPYGAYLIGDESNLGFRIIRDSSSAGPVNVDFFIFEMDN